MTQAVTILGAGAVGLCSALSLRARGMAVTVIDRGAPGQETSSGNAGIISPWSVIPQSLPGLWRSVPGLMFGRYRPLTVRPGLWPRFLPWAAAFLRNGSEAKLRRSAAAMELLCGPAIGLYRDHLRSSGHDDLVRDSIYVHAFRRADRQVLNNIDYRLRREIGAPLELIGQDALRRLEPALAPDFQAAVLIHDQARALSPGAIMTALAQKAAAMGVVFVRDQVQTLVPEAGGWRIRGAAQDYTASHVVVALGIWSAGLMRGLGLRVPLMAERGYHLEYGDEVQLTHSVMDMDAKFVASSMKTGLRVAGQAEFADVSAPPNPRIPAQMARQARAMLPGLRAAPQRRWMGARPSFPDSLPMIGPFARFPGLYAAFGHSHYGLMMAPQTGEYLAAMLSGAPVNADLSAFATDRFDAGVMASAGYRPDPQSVASAGPKTPAP